MKLISIVSLSLTESGACFGFECNRALGLRLWAYDEREYLHILHLY